MAFGINVKQLTAELTAKFDQLLAKLDEILVELRKQSPPPPATKAAAK